MLPLKAGPGGRRREALGAGSPALTPAAWNREEKGNEKQIPWPYPKVLLKSSHYFLWKKEMPYGGGASFLWTLECGERWGRDHHGPRTEGRRRE